MGGGPIAVMQPVHGSGRTYAIAYRLWLNPGFKEGEGWNLALWRKLLHLYPGVQPNGATLPPNELGPNPAPDAVLYVGSFHGSRETPIWDGLSPQTMNDALAGLVGDMVVAIEPGPAPCTYVVVCNRPVLGVDLEAVCLVDGVRRAVTYRGPYDIYNKDRPEAMLVLVHRTDDVQFSKAIRNALNFD